MFSISLSLSFIGLERSESEHDSTDNLKKRNKEREVAKNLFLINTSL